MVAANSTAVFRQESALVHPSSRGRKSRIAFYYVYIACTLGASVALLIPQSASGRGSNTVFSVAWILLHYISLLIFLGFKPHFSKNLVLVFLIGAYIVSSSIWSDSPFDSLVYGGMLAANIATAYMISIDHSLDEFVHLVARVVLFLAFFGTVAAALGSQQALYFDAGNRLTILGTHPIRGLFNHKVPAALFASIGAIACMYKYRSWKRVSSVLFLGLFVLLTGSSTGLLLYPLAIVAFILFQQMYAHRATPASIIFLLAAGLSLVALILSTRWEALLSGLGRDSTLTGRTLLWRWGFDRWLERPLFGWGFKGYFNGPHASEISQTIKRFENYEVPHFHQSFIQTAVDLGLIGFVILLVLVFSSFYRAIQILHTNDSRDSVVVLSWLCVMIAASTTMFIFLQYNQFCTVLLFVMYFGLRRNRLLDCASIHRRPNRLRGSA